MTCKPIFNCITENEKVHYEDENCNCASQAFPKPTYFQVDLPVTTNDNDTVTSIHSTIPLGCICTGQIAVTPCMDCSQFNGTFLCEADFVLPSDNHLECTPTIDPAGGNIRCSPFFRAGVQNACNPSEYLFWTYFQYLTDTTYNICAGRYFGFLHKLQFLMTVAISKRFTNPNYPSENSNTLIRPICRHHIFIPPGASIFTCNISDIRVFITIDNILASCIPSNWINSASLCYTFPEYLHFNWNGPNIFLRNFQQINETNGMTSTFNYCSFPDTLIVTPIYI